MERKPADFPVDPAIAHFFIISSIVVDM